MEIAVEMLERIVAGGRIAELHKAQKGYKCDECGLPIEPKSYYYSVTRAGAGLGSINSPDRVHLGCVESFMRG